LLSKHKVIYKITYKSALMSTVL